MKIANDPEIAAHAARADFTSFTAALTEDERGVIDMHWKNGGRLKGAVLMPGRRHWYVTVFLGGRLRVVGRITATSGREGIEKAARFSDMARQYFSKYRVQARLLELNLSVQRVTEDLKRELKFIKILKDIEAILLGKSLIKDNTEARAIHEKLAKSKPANLTELFIKSLQLMTEMKTTQSSVAANTARIEHLAEQQGGVLTLLTDISKQQSLMVQLLTAIATRLNNFSVTSAPVVPGLPETTYAAPVTESAKVCCGDVKGLVISQ